MNNTAEEAFNLSTYLCSAHKLHNANVHAHSDTQTLHSPVLKKQHITIDNCSSQSLTGLFFLLLLSVCDTPSDSLDEVLVGAEGGWGSIICQDCSLIDHWNLQDFDLHGLWPGGGKGSRVSYQKGALLQTFLCWVINLAVTELSFKASFASTSPLLWLCPGHLGMSTPRKGWPGSLSLPHSHHSSNHLIRAVFDDECSERR